MVLVQKGAPHDLLLGTDTKPKLRIALVTQEVDLLTQTAMDQLKTGDPLGGGALGMGERSMGPRQDSDERLPLKCRMLAVMEKSYTTMELGLQNRTVATAPWTDPRNGARVALRES